jgi:hypothetical protein
VTTGFGLAHIKGEGAPAHPDDFDNENEMSDEQYLRQLQAYKDHYKLTVAALTGCVRDRLLPRLT